MAAPLADIIAIRNADVNSTSPEPGLLRKVLAYNDKLFLAEHRMEKGWVGSVHSHPHEQIVYVVSGHLRVVTDDETFDLRAGDSFVVRGGKQHGASALEECLVIDVFTPCREDYL